MAVNAFVAWNGLYLAADYRDQLWCSFVVCFLSLQVCKPKMLTEPKFHVLLLCSKAQKLFLSCQNQNKIVFEKWNTLPHNDGDCHFMQERQSGGWPYIVDSTSLCPVPRQNGDAVTKCTTLVPCYFSNWSTGIRGVITLSPRSQWIQQLLILGSSWY